MKNGDFKFMFNLIEDNIELNVKYADNITIGIKNYSKIRKNNIWK